jgi:hypothetical protein
MKKNGIKAKIKRRFKATTKFCHGLLIEKIIVADLMLDN